MRPKKVDPPYRLTLALPSSTVGKLDLVITNPATGKVPYGARAEIADALLSELLDSFMSGKTEMTGRPAMALLRKYASGA